MKLLFLLIVCNCQIFEQLQKQFLQKNNNNLVQQAKTIVQQRSKDINLDQDSNIIYQNRQIHANELFKMFDFYKKLSQICGDEMQKCDFNPEEKFNQIIQSEKSKEQEQKIEKKPQQIEAKQNEEINIDDGDKIMQQAEEFINKINKGKD